MKLMSRASVLLLCVLMAVTGCKKSGGCPENNAVAPAAEGQMVQDYLTTNSITATKHKSNMYYQIITPGTGGSPNQCSTVLVNYTLKLTNGTTVPQGSGDHAFNLQGLIPAWIQGIPLLQKGGSIRLFVPPSLGYGGTDQIDPITKNVTIPANSILIFDINLVDFQ